MIYSGYSCDKCGKAIEYQRTSDKWIPGKTTLIRFARRDGWSVGKQVLCPSCKKRRKGEKE